MQYGTDSLATLPEKGPPPETRMKDARSTQDWFRRLIDNDSRRSYKRARVNGLVGGNPPYKLSRLREAGRADAANFNSGNARSYMEAGAGSFYDLSSEAPSCITVRTAHGTPQQRNDWSDIISEAADIIFKKDTLWDYQMQISQWDMVLHGCGPFVFEDGFQVFPRAVLCGDLKVPEFTKSETGYWEAGGLQVTYYPPELYRFIRNSKAAEAIGWDVEYTRRVIANAMDIRQQAGIQYEWEFFEQECKNNSLSYYDDSKICRVAHCFWEEFDGRITHGIVERDTADGLEVKYLFLKVGRYANWQEAVHPMYFDHGNGGYHHSVTGLGVKMYSLMEYENRLLCNLCDKAFSPKIIFNPTTTEASQKFSLMRLGDFAVAPKGFQMNQTGVAGLMNDGLAMRQTLQDVMGSTLSGYKQGLPVQKSGNPVTKFEKQMEAAMQSAMSKTQYNRYYKQLDMLYAEIYRRLSDLNNPDERAVEFQKYCKERGVSKEALGRTEYVGATRVVGQGSAFMRKQAIDSLFPIAGALPEDGRENLIKDKIACEAGQPAVTRYYPRPQKQPMADDQQVGAMAQVVAMKTGVPAIVTSTQNAVTYAATFLKAATDALASLQKGGDPHGVLAFLELAGPAIAAQLRRFGQDPTRKQIHETMMQQWQQLAQVTDQLKSQLINQAKQAQAQQKKTQGAMTDAQIKSANARQQIALKNAKTQAQLKQSEEKHRLKMAQQMQDMALKDASTAADIHLNRLKSFQE